MLLPEKVRVKLSSEAAGAISLTPVVVQELPLRELVEYMLGVAGKDEARIREILLRGTLVSGATRFRWNGWDAGDGALATLLASFPDADPSRPFAAACCVRAVLRGGRNAIEIPREAGSRKGLLGRHSFWDVLMEVVAAAPPVYTGYSYRDRADRYMREFTRAEAGSIRAAAESAAYTTLREQIRVAPFAAADLLTVR